ncbi:MAG: hypothetical protein IJT35_02130 [Paludibacteraceae bacterium]|nr:hypothetical protein [Paludibacteraceae bacterium]
MSGLIYFITIVAVIIIFRTVSAATKENKDKKTMDTANNQSPTSSTPTSAMDAAGVPVTSHDIIKAMDDMLHIYLKLQNSLNDIEQKENQNT